jgi:hypothetical protein
MMARRRRWLLGLAVVLLGAAGLTLHMVWLAGEFNAIEPHFDGTCARIEGVAGAEDMALDAQGHRVFLSAVDRRAAAAGEAVRGDTWSLDLDRPVERVRY